MGLGNWGDFVLPLGASENRIHQHRFSFAFENGLGSQYDKTAVFPAERADENSQKTQKDLLRFLRSFCAFCGKFLV